MKRMTLTLAFLFATILGVMAQYPLTELKINNSDSLKRYSAKSIIMLDEKFDLNVLTQRAVSWQEYIGMNVVFVHPDTVVVKKDTTITVQMYAIGAYETKLREGIEISYTLGLLINNSKFAYEISDIRYNGVQKGNAERESFTIDRLKDEFEKSIVGEAQEEFSEITWHLAMFLNRGIVFPADISNIQPVYKCNILSLIDFKPVIDSE